MRLALKGKGTVVALFFALLTVIGLWTAGDYTGSYDELWEQDTLRSNMKEYALWLEKAGLRSEYWLQSNVVPISESTEKDHGISGYYLYGLLMPRLMENQTLRFWIWNAVNWLWFMLGVWSLYAIARHLGLSRMLGCTTALLLYLSPRFFADAHVNNKDMVLLAQMLAVLWLGARFVQCPNIRRGLAFSFMGAMAMNTKIVAVIAWGMMWVGTIIKLTAAREWNGQKIVSLLASVLSFAGFYCVLTPAMWSAPVQFFRYLLSNAAGFTRWEGTLFFRGASFQLPENPLPVYYLPYMMMVTIPLYTLALSAFGQIAALVRGVRTRLAMLKSSEGVLLAAATLCWIAPVAGFALLRPLVYNGWRHFYFSFAGLAVLAAYGLGVLWKLCSSRKVLRIICALVLCVCLGATAVGIAANHPRQSSYYNALSGNSLMETDYWNTSCTYALEKLIACEERNQTLPLEVGCYFMDIQNARFKMSDEHKALLTTTVEKDSPYLYYIENYVQVYNVPKPEGYHALFEVESYGRLIGTMYEREP